MKLTLTLDLSSLPKRGAMFFDVARELHRAALQMTDGTYDAPEPRVGSSAPVLDARGYLIGGWRITDHDEPLPTITDEQAGALQRLQEFIDAQGDMGLENALSSLRHADPQTANAHADELNALEAQVSQLRQQNEALRERLDAPAEGQLTPEEASALIEAHRNGKVQASVPSWVSAWAKLQVIARGDC